MSVSAEEGANHVATEVAKLTVKIDGLVDQLKESNARSDRIQSDHETRIRWLERLAWGVPLSVISSVITAYITFKGK